MPERMQADQKGPCCNPVSGYCGNARGVRWGHCDCETCVDFSRETLQEYLNSPKHIQLGKQQEHLLQQYVQKQDQGA